MHTAQLIQIVGALLNMGAFALLHFEIAPSSALRYLIPNWLGSVLLVMSAYVDRQWGFLMLETAWVVVTGYAIAGKIRTAAVLRNVCIDLLLEHNAQCNRRGWHSENKAKHVPVLAPRGARRDGST